MRATIPLGIMGYQGQVIEQVEHDAACGIVRISCRRDQRVKPIAAGIGPYIDQCRSRGKKTIATDISRDANWIDPALSKDLPYLFRLLQNNAASSLKSTN